jgi:hypothetical protein
MAYLLYLFTPSELERFSPAIFLPHDIYTEPHPLLRVLEDISDTILDEEQQKKVKSLLMEL